MSETNPFVTYLNRYTTASPDHEAAFDEFIGQTPPPGGAPLRLETRTEAFVRDCFARPGVHHQSSSQAMLAMAKHTFAIRSSPPLLVR